MSSTARSTDYDPQPQWVRWVLPSAGDLIFIALLGLLTLTTLSVRLLGDAGIGWHIRTGQLICAEHAIPHVDPFSASGGQPWVAWEWLYDVIVGWIERVAGLNGVVLLTAVVIAGVFSWTFRLLLRRGTNILVAVVLLLLAASASMIHFLSRPHVFSWLFAVAWFWILESRENHRDAESSAGTLAQSRRLWLLPPLMLIWVNVHGGFLLGFALLAIYWLSALRRSRKPAGDRFERVLESIRAGQQVRTLTWVGILTAVATLANPYGFKLHFHIYRYLSNRFLMDHIDEFQSPNFHYVAQKCFAGLLLLTLVALAAKRREIALTHGLLVLFAVFSGLYASRDIPVSSLLLILVIGPWLSDAMARYDERRIAIDRAQKGVFAGFLRRMRQIELNLRGHLWPVAALVLNCWIAAHPGKLGAEQLMDAHFDGKRFPVAAVSYLEKQNIQGPLLGPDYWGGYLIYRLYPRAKVVVDDRHDFYGEKFLKSYLKMVHVEPGWQEFLEQHPAQCVIMPEDSALTNILAESRGWGSLYRDEVAVVFVRAGEGAE